MLGMASDSSVPTISFFSPSLSSQQQLIHGLNCGGNESTLAECGHDDFGSTPCGNSDIAAVICTK
ncbi:hypothetical protein DPMN_166649, partial [Dreissena polymorpha]